MLGEANLLEYLKVIYAMPKRIFFKVFNKNLKLNNKKISTETLSFFYFFYLIFSFL